MRVTLIGWSRTRIHHGLSNIRPNLTSSLVFFFIIYLRSSLSRFTLSSLFLSGTFCSVSINIVIRFLIITHLSPLPIRTIAVLYLSWLITFSQLICHIISPISISFLLILFLMIFSSGFLKSKLQNFLLHLDLILWILASIWAITSRIFILKLIDIY